MRMKKLAVFFLAGALTAGGTMTSAAAWVPSGSDWKYQSEDGSWQANKWFQDTDGRWYHFDESGLARKGWFKDADGKWYFFAYNGIMQTGLIKVDNKVYYMEDSGSLFAGTKNINGTDYNFTEYGTTNGSPSVGASRIWGGNGNQSSTSTFGGSGHSGSSKSTTKSPEVTAVETEIADAINNKGISSSYAEFSISGEKVTVSISDEEKATALKGALNDAEDILSQILAVETVKNVKIGSVTLNQDSTAEELKQAAVSLGFNAETKLGDLTGKKATVTLANGETIVYTFSIK